MSDTKKTTQGKAEDATCAYLERCGWTVVERDYKTDAGKAQIIALDGNTLVFVRVIVFRSSKASNPRALSSTTIAKYARIMREYQADAGTALDVRFDEVSLLIIAEDRALLRHHRDAYQVKGGE